MTDKEMEELNIIYFKTETNIKLRDKKGRFEKWAKNRFKKHGQFALVTNQKSNIYGDFIPTTLLE